MFKPSSTNPDGPTILCVDDDPYILISLDRLLRRNGWHVLQATDGESALEILGQSRVEVVMCDEAMPGMRGLDVLTRAKEISPQTARVLLTAYCHDPKVVISAVNQCEIFRLLSKPWSDEELVEVATAALGTTPREWQQRKERLAVRLETIEQSSADRIACD